MKNNLLIFVFIFATYSCSKELDFDKFPQEWQLISMYGENINTPSTETDMEWQESYLLKSNGTFTKHRERDGILSVASGTFMFKDLKDGKFLELTLDSGTALIGSCTPGLKETIWIRSVRKMTSTWSNCDGPGLEYERIR